MISTAVARNSSLGEGVEHSALFPEDLVCLSILMATEEGDLALDPFIGSGTTGRVSNAHRRFYVGMISSNTLGTAGLYTDSQPSLTCSLHFFISFPLETDFFFAIFE